MVALGKPVDSGKTLKRLNTKIRKIEYKVNRMKQLMEELGLLGKMGCKKRIKQLMKEKQELIQELTLIEQKMQR